MRLTNVLLRWKRPLPKGSIWHGKNKLYKEVTPLILAKKKIDFDLEEKNMLYLRNPYLTPEQSAVMPELFKYEERILAKEQEKNLKWIEHKNLGDRFGFLKVTDAWEPYC